MACQTLSSGLNQTTNPSGSVAQTVNPGTGGICRTYNFEQGDDLVTFFFEEPILTFAGNQIETFH